MISTFSKFILTALQINDQNRNLQPYSPVLSLTLCTFHTRWKSMDNRSEVKLKF